MIETAGSAWQKSTRRLSMTSGVFALLWAVVVVLMIVRPGDRRVLATLIARRHRRAIRTSSNGTYTTHGDN